MHVIQRQNTHVGMLELDSVEEGHVGAADLLVVYFGQEWHERDEHGVGENGVEGVDEQANAVVEKLIVAMGVAVRRGHVHPDGGDDAGREQKRSVQN